MRLTDNLKRTYGSSIAEYVFNNRECAEKFSVDLFSKLSNSLSSFHLKVFETVHILSSRPSLCKQRKCLLGLNTISIVFNIIFFLHPIYFPYFFIDGGGGGEFVLFFFFFFFSLYHPRFSFVERGSKPVTLYQTPDSNPRSRRQLCQVRTRSSIMAPNITPQGHNLV